MFNKVNIHQRDKMMKDFLNTRQKIKERELKEKEQQQGFEERSEKLFKPLTKSLNENVENLQMKIESKIGDTEKQLASNQKTIFKAINQAQSTIPAIKPTPQISVSKLIQEYLSSSDDRSNAGYSIRYNTKIQAYTIGDSKISFHNNDMNIAGKIYNATKGLMELLTKKDPDTDDIIDEDYDDYKNILIDTNAIYHNFDKATNRKIGDKSEKWKIISKLLSIEKRGDGIKLKTIILPENNDELIDMLKLSLASHHSGNNGEYNKIHAILDRLLKNKIITRYQYIEIIKKQKI